MGIELRGVSLGYRGRMVLENLDWDVVCGEFHVLLGASGSGKTTLLRLIAGLEQPQSGSIRIDGRDTTQAAAHLRSVAMVGQTAASYDHLSVLENLRFAERLSGHSLDGMREDLIEQFGLGRTLGQKPSELSGGELQRLAIARALLTGRRFLLMDEPLAHLQEALRSPIRRLLRRWQQQRGLTCIYVTHDSQEACELADRISVMGAGKIQQTGAAADVYRHPVSRAVAQIMGRPSVEWVTDTRTGREVGLRPSDWKLTPLAAALSRVDCRLQVELDRAEGIGRLVSVRPVESTYWCEVQVGEQSLRVVRQESSDLEIGGWVKIVNDHPIWIEP